jgi:hypothetical protein
MLGRPKKEEEEDEEECPDAPRLYFMCPLCPVSVKQNPVTLLNFQITPSLILLISSGSKKKEPRYTSQGFTLTKNMG